MLKKINLENYKVILFVALVVRIISALFSKGYGMHDDHFIIIETAASWADGIDKGGWLPWSKHTLGAPLGQSFSYVGLNFLFFKFWKIIGFSDPQTLMLLNRIAHGIFSLLIVHFGIKITALISTKRNSVLVGWILALLWVFPFLSVRNLVEFAAIPFLMWGVWLLLKKGEKSTFLYAGLLIGIALSFRYQIAIFAIAIAIYYFFTKKYKEFIYFSLGVTLTFCITQGVVDFIVWGKPFVQFFGYALYNVNEGTRYLPNSNYFMYFFVLMGVMLIPLGPLLMIGFFRSRKIQPLIFIPCLVFILFHTIYPNRQERFIISILPFFIILGVIGFEQLKQTKFWKKIWSVSLTIFWSINIPLLIFLSLTYSKMSRVEAMYSLHNYNLNNKSLLIEASAETEPSMLPMFYADDWTFTMSERIVPFDQIENKAQEKFDFILFFGEERIKERINDYKKVYPNIQLVKKCNPSVLDLFLRKMNKHNSNQYIEVWKTNAKAK
jgi:hypothetical protein